MTFLKHGRRAGGGRSNAKTTLLLQLFRHKTPADSLTLNQYDPNDDYELRWRGQQIQPQRPYLNPNIVHQRVKFNDTVDRENSRRFVNPTGYGEFAGSNPTFAKANDNIQDRSDNHNENHGLRWWGQ